MRLASLRFTALVVLAFCRSALPQTLAHPNWVGNGMSTDPWWQHAVIYRVDVGPEQPSGAVLPAAIDYRYLAARVHALRTIGVDALLLPAPAIPEQGSASEPPSEAIQRDIDQLDDLIRTGSSRGVRVLLTLSPASAQTDLTGIARFWLNRGIAGFHVSTPPGANPADAFAMVQSLRRLTAGVVGQRIVISELDLATADASVPTQAAPPIVRRPAAARAPHSSDIAPQLELDTRATAAEWNAASLRAMLARTANRPNVLFELNHGTHGPAVPRDRASLSRVVATLSLLTHPAALVNSEAHLVLEPMPEHAKADEPDPSTKPPPAPAPAAGVYLPYKPYVPPSKARPQAEPAPRDPLTAWYKQLAALHHVNLAVRAGNATFLDFDAQNAVVWVSRGPSGSASGASVVVACNLSGSPVELSLRAAMVSLGLKGNYLRTLLRSDTTMGAQEIASVTLPAYGVYIGELRR